MDKEENIIDYYHGNHDIRRKLIKSVGDPMIRLEEDALRILRAVRFATIHKYKIDNSLKEAILKNKDLLKNISYERKKEELNKIFCSKHRKYGIKLLKTFKLTEPLEINNIDNALLNNDLIGIWATITDVDYAFTKTEKDLIKKIRELIDLDVNDIFIEYKYGLYPLTIVSNLKKYNVKKITNRYNNLPIKDKSEIKITYDDICEILKKEPEDLFKNIMDDLENNILRGNLNNDTESIKEFILNNYKEV